MTRNSQQYTPSPWLRATYSRNQHALAAANEHGLRRDEPVLARRENDPLRLLDPFSEKESFLRGPIGAGLGNVCPWNLMPADAEETHQHRRVALKHGVDG